MKLVRRQFPRLAGLGASLSIAAFSLAVAQTGASDHPNRPVRASSSTCRPAAVSTPRPASWRTGTASHLTAELFMALTKTSLVHVPYKGTSPALNDLIAGHVDSSFIVLSSALELAEAGKLRILAVATDQRLDVLPDIPTMVESGYPKLISSTWNAISAPPRTPAEIVIKLNAAINEALQEGQVQARLRELQMIPAGGSPTVTKALIETERRQWGEVVQAAGIKPE